jgi:hypothetical protein
MMFWVYDLRELIGDHVRSVFIRSTEPDEITLIDCLRAGQIIKASVQNVWQRCLHSVDQSHRESEQYEV